MRKRTRGSDIAQIRLWTRDIFVGVDAAPIEITTLEEGTEGVHQVQVAKAVASSQPENVATSTEEGAVHNITSIVASDASASFRRDEGKVGHDKSLNGAVGEQQTDGATSALSLRPDFPDAAPVAAALLDGELGDVVVALRLNGIVSSISEPQRIRILPNSPHPPPPLGAYELVLLVRGESFFSLSHDSLPVMPFLASLLAASRVRKYIFDAPAVYAVVLAFLGSERLTSTNVCDLSLAATFVFPLSSCTGFAKLTATHFGDVLLPGGLQPSVSANAHTQCELHVCWHMGKRFDDVALSGRLARALDLDTRAEFLCSLMSFHGFMINFGVWRDAVAQLDARLSFLHDSIVSVTSTVDPKFDALDCDMATLEHFLLERMELAKTLRSEDIAVIKRGASAALEVLAGSGHRVAGEVLEAKELLSQREVLLQSFNRHAVPNRRTERVLSGLGDRSVWYSVHPEFHCRGIKTGRIFSSSPNLQNMPKGSAMRRLYKAPPDCSLLSFDFNQVELRVLAHFCGDPALTNEFKARGDVLRRMAREIFKLPSEDAVSSVQRNATKIVVYGILYGLGDTAMQARLPENVSAAEVRRTFFHHYPGVAEFLDDVKSHALFRQEAFTLLGRRRALHEAAGDELNAQRLALSTMIQGTAAEVLKTAMWSAHQLQQELCRSGDSTAAIGSSFALLLTVHDELVFAVRSAQLREVAAAIEAAIVQGCAGLGMNVPLVLSIKSGPSLGELEPLSVRQE